MKKVFPLSPILLFISFICIYAYNENGLNIYLKISLLCLFISMILMGINLFRHRVIKIVLVDAIILVSMFGWSMEEIHNREGNLYAALLNKPVSTSIEYTHNDLNTDGIQGIIDAVSKRIHLPKKLYTNNFTIKFNNQLKIINVDAIIYGKIDNKIKMYIISYQTSNKLNVISDEETSNQISDDYLLSPFIEIVKKNHFYYQSESDHVTLSYSGKQSITGNVNVKLVNKSINEQSKLLNKLNKGGSLKGYTATLTTFQLNENQNTYYMLNPTYITGESIETNNNQNLLDSNKDTWVENKEDRSLLYKVREDLIYRLNMIDAALGTYYYQLDKSVDQTQTWNVVNRDPFLGMGGAAIGIRFINEKIGFIGMANASMDYSSLFQSRDGGKTFKKITLPKQSNIKLPDNHQITDYKYLEVPYKEKNQLIIKAKLSYGDLEYIKYSSNDKGKTWKLIKYVK